MVDTSKKSLQCDYMILFVTAIYVKTAMYKNIPCKDNLRWSI